MDIGTLEVNGELRWARNNVGLTLSAYYILVNGIFIIGTEQFPMLNLAYIFIKTPANWDPHDKTKVLIMLMILFSKSL